MDFTSFFIMNLRYVERVRRIILYGSVARGSSENGSDVDLFVDTDEDLSDEVERLRDEFYRSARFTKHWRLMGVENELHVVTGKLDEWQDLKSAMAVHGTVLYGPYTEMRSGRLEAIVTWDPVKPASSRVLLNKRLFGFKQEGRIYSGLVERLTGSKLGPRCILVPAEHLGRLMHEFDRLGLVVRVRHMRELPS
jgi:hypothetical protein